MTTFPHTTGGAGQRVLGMAHELILKPVSRCVGVGLVMCGAILRWEVRIHKHGAVVVHCPALVLDRPAAKVLGGRFPGVPALMYTKTPMLGWPLS